MRGNDGLRLCQERFRLDNEKCFFSEGTVKQWHSCPGSGRGGSPSPKVSQNHREVALRDGVSGNRRGGLGLVMIAVLSNLNDAMILHHVPFIWVQSSRHSMHSCCARGLALPLEKATVWKMKSAPALAKANLVCFLSHFCSMEDPNCRQLKQH